MPLPRPPAATCSPALAGGAASIALPAWAQSGAFPTRSITLICPWPPGGSTDRHLRTLAEIASRHLGQTVVVENKPGGGGTTGPGTMALTAKPDGYTIAQFPMGMLRLPHMQKMSVGPLIDFTFIIGVSGYTFGLTVRADSPYKTFNEYIEAARKSPGPINYGSTGIGTSPHLLMEELAANAKVQLTHVPFKGNADLQQALLGGHVMAQSDASGWDKFVDGGQMRLLVTFGEKRTKRWPTVPTAQELGYNVISTSPYGFVGPRAWTRRSRGRCTTRSRRRWTTRNTSSCSTSSTRTRGTAAATTTRSGRATASPATSC
jgi:tripartite-type tricarboxylate transporter receptor subunit TctC